MSTLLLQLRTFVRESNLIEGIEREPTPEECEALGVFLKTVPMTLDSLNRMQAVFAPGAPLRDSVNMDVRVGRHIAPRGGPLVVAALVELLAEVNLKQDAWNLHCRFEYLHPYMDGNGRTGRAVWLWLMQQRQDRPYALPFLHRFYYQTLAAQEKEQLT